MKKYWLLFSCIALLSAGWITAFRSGGGGNPGRIAGTEQHPILGINFNENLDPDFVHFSEIRHSTTTWVRGFITFFDLYHKYKSGDVNWFADPRLLTYQKIHDSGYRTVLNIRYMFKKYGLAIPSKQSGLFADYLDFTDSLLNRLLPETDIIVAGNEPFIDVPASQQESRELVDFYIAVADRIHDYLQKHHVNIPLFVGAFENADESFREQNPAYNRLLSFAKETEWVTGVDVHIHHTYNRDIRKALNYVSERIRREQKIIITEFSLRKWWDLHLKDRLSPAFKSKYRFAGIDTVWQYLDFALQHPRPLAEWNDWNEMTPWLSSRKAYLRNAWKIFNEYPQFWMGFYSFKLDAPRKFTSKSSGWILNSLLVNNTVERKSSGESNDRIWYMDEFKSIQERRRRVEKPNIVLIYTDDLGYGDLSCQGAVGVKTPHIDSLARHGVRFTDAHSSASTCTPSRYAILTGSYAFRNNAVILPGSAPLLIRPGTPTLPGMLREEGYKTAVIGKWHLGLGDGSPDWNGDLKPGPKEVGFDYSFIVPATLDRVPTVFVKNYKVYHRAPDDSIEISYEHRVGHLPTGLDHPEMLKMRADSQHSGTIVDSISRIGFMAGGKSAWWKDEHIAATLIDEVRTFFERNQDHPFFLYFSVTDIHVPRDPDARFTGKSSLGPRGDAIAEMDWSAGMVTKMLDSLGLSKNTLVIFTSDNGPVLDDGYADSAVALAGNDQPGGPFSGGKYSAFEAGTRMPTIAFWPGKIKPKVSDALFSQVDLYASFAALVGHKLRPNEAPDSRNMLDVLLGRSATGRGEMLEEAYTLALRSGPWKYIAPQTKPTPDWLKNKDIPTGLSDSGQLYRLDSDIKEEHNLMSKFPGQAAKMQAILYEIQRKEGTRPGFGLDKK